MKNFVVLVAISLTIAGCGRNPHLEGKSPSLETVLAQPLTPALQVAAPRLVLREKDSKAEDVLNFGEVKIGDKLVKNFELSNVGNAKASEVKIPATIGKFKITNVNCASDLEAKDSCDLKGELISTKEIDDQSDLVVKYKNPSGETQSTKMTLLGRVKAIVVVPDAPVPKPRLILIVKNDESGNAVVRDVPVGETVIIQFELRNIGNANATHIVLPVIPAPFVIDHQNCTENLAVDQFCEIFVKYTPTKPQQDNIQIRVKSDGAEVVQTIVANSIILDSGSKIEVVDGQINQDIYEILNVKPESISPFQDIRGIDLGVLPKGKDSIFSINLNNLGENDATVTNIKDFQGSIFSFNQKKYPGISGTCGLVIPKGKCSLNVKVSPTTLGNIHDLVEITYQDKRGALHRLSILLFASVKEETVVACKTLTARSIVDQAKVVSSLTAEGKYKLPYRLKSTVSSAALGVAFNTQSNHNLRMSKNAESLVVPSNHNVMVQFGFDISKEELAKYKSAKIELDILKISSEGVKFDTTEILCLNENKHCSGTFFIDSNYSHLNTSNYVMQSNYFSQELLRSSQQDISSLREILSSRGSLSAQGAATPLNRIFRLKKSFPLMSLFGSSKGDALDLSKGLNFILADDSVLISTPRLILESDDVTCGK